jgi:transposase
MPLAPFIELRCLKGTKRGIVIYMRPKGSAKELEVRRRIGGKLPQEGKGVREVARLVEASPSTVSRWRQALEEGGMAALRAKPHPGRRARLKPEQKKRLERVLLAGPQAAGFATDLWTLARVAQVIELLFGVKYHPGHIWYILRDMDWSCQKPERRARERDEAAIKTWRKRDWPRIKKRRATGYGASF